MCMKTPYGRNLSGDRQISCEVMVIFVYPSWPTVLDFIEPQIAPFDQPTRKTMGRTKRGVDRTHRLRDIRL